MEKSNLPAWLARAFDASTPMTDDNETMRTIDVEIDGKMFLVPTIRMNEDGTLYKLDNEEAVEKAKELGDALPVPEGMNATEFSKALSDAVPQRKAKGGAIMAIRAQRGQANLPMTEATSAPQGGGPKAGNPETLMAPPQVPQLKGRPGGDPRDEAIELVMHQSQKKEMPPPAPSADGNAEPTDLASVPPMPEILEGTPPAQGLGAPAPETTMMAKRGGTKEDKEGMSVVIGLGGSPMPPYEEASMGTPADPPPGATPDEVADDKHVLMSEGELVVPANVVRYHGLGTYEGLRREALMGLSEMEQSGQINYDNGIQKAQTGLMNANPSQIVGTTPSQFGNFTNPSQFGINPPYYPFPPQYGINPPPMYGPITNPYQSIVAGNVGEYKDIINPPKDDDDDGAPKPPEVVTSPAALAPKPDPREDSTSRQSMAQAQADMDRSYDNAVAQAIAAGFTTPEDIAKYIQEGNVKADTPLGSFGIPGMLFNNMQRPDGTRPIDAAVSRYFKDKVPYEPYTKEQIDSMDQEVGGDVGDTTGDTTKVDEVNAQTDEILEEPSKYEGSLSAAEKSRRIPDVPVAKPKVNVVRDDRGTTISGSKITTDDEGKVTAIDDKPAVVRDEKKEETKPCVIATHGVATGGFSPMEKAKAEIWCAKTYHGKWYGEAFRRGYRYLGTKHVQQGTASQFYNEFKDFVAFGRGLKKGLKLSLNYYFRTLQFFITGLFVSKDV